MGGVESCLSKSKLQKLWMFNMGYEHTSSRRFTSGRRAGLSPPLSDAAAHGPWPCRLQRDNMTCTHSHVVSSADVGGAAGLARRPVIITPSFELDSLWDVADVKRIPQ